MRFIAALLILTASCLAQAGRAELFGTIQDPSNLPVANARVQAVDQATMAPSTAISNPRGEYHLLGLTPGRYTVTVEQPGFRTYRQSGITLRVGDRTPIDVRLQVGQPAESVDVTAAAPLLQTATGDVGYHLDGSTTSSLPLDGRNF